MRKHVIATSVKTTFALVLAGATAVVFFGATAHTPSAGTAPAAVVAGGPTPSPTASTDNTPWG